MFASVFICFAYKIRLFCIRIDAKQAKKTRFICLEANKYLHLIRFEPNIAAHLILKFSCSLTLWLIKRGSLPHVVAGIALHQCCLP